MARPVDFPGATLTLPGSNDVAPIRVFATPKLMVTCWQLTPAERAEIDRTGCIWLAHFAGEGKRPATMIMGTRGVVRNAAADYGPTWEDDDG